LNWNGLFGSIKQDMRHEKLPEIASNGCGGNDRSHRFERTFVRSRRRRGKYHGLAWLSASFSGIAAATVTTKRAAVLHTPAPRTT
jgi:hypothetical protein